AHHRHPCAPGQRDRPPAALARGVCRAGRGRRWHRHGGHHRHRRRPDDPVQARRPAVRPGAMGGRPGRDQGGLATLPAGGRTGPVHGRRGRRAAGARDPGGGEAGHPPRRPRCRHAFADAPGAVRRLPPRVQPVPRRRAGGHPVRRGRTDLRVGRRARPRAPAAGGDARGRRGAGLRRGRLRLRHGQQLQPARAAAGGRPGMSAVRFDRDAVRAFRFVRCGFDAGRGVAELVYALDDGPELVETITLPGAPFALDPARARAAEQALRLLHLVAGVSYYKAAVPPEIRIEGHAIDAATAALLEEVYVNGLGEFAYRNGLDLRGRVRFPSVAGAADGDAPALGLRPHALVAIGGGKDSLVTIEALREAGVEQTVTWIGSSQLIRACAGRTGLPALNIGRQLAPELFEYNRLGAWNGHIPVTAVNSAIMA